MGAVRREKLRGGRSLADQAAARRLGAVALGLAWMQPAVGMACEPIVPLMQVLVGPLGFVGPLLLPLAVFCKCLAFGYFQSSLTTGRAMLLMLAGNLVSTFVGLAAAMLLAAPSTALPLLPLLLVLAWTPARRLLAMTPGSSLQKLGPAGISSLMLGLFLASVLLWGQAQQVVLTENMPHYWALKLAYVYAALLLSLFLTAFWEEWTIGALAGRLAGEKEFITPVLRANFVVLGGVLLLATAVVLPKRFQSPTGLVEALQLLWTAATA